MFPNLLTTDYANAMHAARLEDFTATQAVRRGRTDRQKSTRATSRIRIGVAGLLAAVAPAVRRTAAPAVDPLSITEPTPAG